MLQQEISQDKRRRLLSFSIIAVIAILLTMFGFQQGGIEDAPLAVPDRLTRTEFNQTVAEKIEPRDLDRAKLWEIVCRNYPDEPECLERRELRE